LKNQKILITGASGFVGRHVLTACIEKGYEIIAPSRQPINSDEKLVKNPTISNLLDICVLPQFDKSIVTIVHIAGLAHRHDVPLRDYITINSDHSLEIAKKAIELGVKRFIFFSSIGVNGNITSEPFTESDQPAPKEDYAKSKWDAEQKLIALSKQSGLELIIIRPPLIYGPSAPGNFSKLLKLANSGFPSPLGKIDNKRSFISVFNLSDFVIACIKAEDIIQETFLVSDNQDISTKDLLTLLYKQTGKKNRLVKVSYRLLHNCLKLVGKSVLLEKLCCNLQVDNQYAMRKLGWSPPYSVEVSLSMCSLKNKDKY
jgi:nucleoside-diphosphate-sugar epimerase